MRKQFTPNQRAYFEKLKDPRWQKRRLEILARDNFTCECGDTESTLHIHHAYYIKNREPWEYPNWSLQTLCADCHKSAGERDEEADVQTTEWEDTMEFLTGGTMHYVSEGLWDVGVQLAMCAQDGFDRHKLCSEIMHLLWNKRMNEEPPK